MDKLDELISEEFEESENKERQNKDNERKLLASEIADKISDSLKPLFEKDDSDKIIKAIKENRPIVNVEPPIIKMEEKKHEIKMPNIKIPEIKIPQSIFKPNIEVKAAEQKIIEVKGFFDFAKLILNILRGKFRLDASKENPIPVQLVYNSKFYEALGGGGGPSRVWIKNKSNQVINPATEDQQIIGTDRIKIEVTRGNIEGWSRFGLGGHAILNSVDGEITLWEEKSKYVYLTENTQLYVSSTDADDDAIVAIDGLWENESGDWVRTIRTVTLNGQSQVAITGKLIRVFNHTAIDNGNVNGTTYIAESDTLTGGVPDTQSKIKSKALPNSVSSNGFMTVPTGKIAVGTVLSTLSNKSKDAKIWLYNRYFGTQFLKAGPYDIFQSTFNTEFIPYFSLPEKTDFEIRAETNDEATSLIVLFNFYLIDT